MPDQIEARDLYTVAADQGVHVFTVTLSSLGRQTLTVADKSSPPLTGKEKVLVSAPWDGRMQPFRAGLGMLTAGTAVPIVPCHLGGAFEAFPAGARLPRPHRVRLRIGGPLVFDAVPNTRAGWERVVAEAEAAVRRLADPPETF